MLGFIFDKNTVHIAHPYHAVKRKRSIFAKANISSLVTFKRSECIKGWEAKCVFNSLLYSHKEVANLKAKLMCTARKSDPFLIHSSFQG